MKNLPEGFNSRFDQEEERSNKLKDGLIEMILSEIQIKE